MHPLLLANIFVWVLISIILFLEFYGKNKKS